jgi:hypothetical protein
MTYPNLQEKPLEINLKRALAGGFLWMIGVAWTWPNPFHTSWAVAILLLAPLFFLPVVLEIIDIHGFPPVSRRFWRIAKIAQCPAAFLLTASYWLSPGLSAAALAVPWLCVTAAVALCGALNFQRSEHRSLHALCVNAGLCYLVIGGAWAVSDRLGFRPLDFKAIIVLLTAIHFHYAGFLLPVLTGIMLRRTPVALARVAAVGAIAGPPLTAVGITATQTGATPLIECLCAWSMAASGMATAGAYFHAALEPNQPKLTSWAWFVAASTLFIAMIFSGLYATRFYAPLEWLDIPWMRVLHGTVNALGFSLAALIGWLSLRRSELRIAFQTTKALLAK